MLFILLENPTRIRYIALPALDFYPDDSQNPDTQNIFWMLERRVSC